jgi:hypothetical protein
MAGLAPIRIVHPGRVFFLPARAAPSGICARRAMLEMPNGSVDENPTGQLSPMVVVQARSGLELR